MKKAEEIKMFQMREQYLRVLKEDAHNQNCSICNEQAIKFDEYHWGKSNDEIYVCVEHDEYVQCDDCEEWFKPKFKDISLVDQLCEHCEPPNMPHPPVSKRRQKHQRQSIAGMKKRQAESNK